MDNIQLEKAEKHIKTAWIAGTISAALTFIYALAGTYNDDFRYKFGLDTWALLDVALIAGLTYGIYRKNRFCALGLLIYFVISKFVSAASSGQFAGGFFALLFAYFYLQGTIAAFKIHKHKIETGEIIKKKKSVGYYLGISFIVLFLFGVGALMVVSLLSPEIEVIPGKQVKKKYLNFVWEQGIVDPSEELQYWYSDAFGDFKNGFYLFTDKKVVIYSQEWEEPSIIIPYSEIADIEFESSTSFIEDSRITLLLNDNSIVYFPVSGENGGDVKFYERLLDVWNANTEQLN